MFIKVEPHKPEKIASKRYRLISCLSLVDQLVDRVLFGQWSSKEIDTVMDRAGKTGWSLLPVGFYDFLETFPDSVLATDCSAFDWTYPAWVVEMIFDIKLQQMESYPPEFEIAVKARMKEVLGSNCVVRLPDGERLRQLIPGIMKSGWYLTINLNSDAQDLITNLAYRRAYHSPCPKLWAMGDDVIMRWPEGQDQQPLVDELKRAGVLSKFATTAREFAGFKAERVMGKVTIDPLYPNKHKYLLAHVPTEQLEEVITSYGLIYALAGDVKDWLSPLLRQYSRWTESTTLAWAYGLLGSTPLVQTGTAGGNFSLH